MNEKNIAPPQLMATFDHRPHDTDKKSIERSQGRVARPSSVSKLRCRVHYQNLLIEQLSTEAADGHA